MTFKSARLRQRGVGLVELMIGLVLGLVVMAAVFQIYLSSRRSFVVSESLAARQEAVRYVTTVVSRDARMAGYFGCLRRGAEITNTLDADAGDFAYRYGRYVDGFDADAETWSPALPGVLVNVTPGTDVLTLRGTFGPEVYIVKEMPNTSADLKSNPVNPAPFADGDIALVTDCAHAAVFQITRYNLNNSGGPNAHFGNIVHNTGNAFTPGNRTKDLGRRYPVGSQIARIDTITYFVRDSASGTGPALWRRTEGEDPAERELAEGVENLQVLYGVDVNGDRAPDAYRTAAEVDAAGDWGAIVTLRVAMLVAGTRDRAGERDPRSFDLLGTSVGPFSDGRLRDVVELTLSLRNQLP
ncbi:PilW family protein [Fontimonas sp. SYSU GA230001]|uniref:PilW family protein n=1 Tax=Fontimonas sp. SYSU GA230001 TaxID=3142450 RepID=UPI0032B51532